MGRHAPHGGVANGVSGTAAPHGARHALYARLRRRGSRRRPVAPTPALQQIRVRVVHTFSRLPSNVHDSDIPCLLVLTSVCSPYCCAGGWRRARRKGSRGWRFCTSVVSTSSPWVFCPHSVFGLGRNVIVLILYVVHWLRLVLHGRARSRLAASNVLLPCKFRTALKHPTHGETSF